MVIEESGNESAETAPPKRRRAPKGDMRRKALLDAATVVFARDGYSSASMREVALLAGITTVGLLHHFPNKEALLAALLERRDQRVTSRFQDLVTEPTLEGFLKFLKLSMSFSIENAEECQAALLMNTESLSKAHPAWAWHLERFQLTHEHARGHLQGLIEAGKCAAISMSKPWPRRSSRSWTACRFSGCEALRTWMSWRFSISTCSDWEGISRLIHEP